METIVTVRTRSQSFNVDHDFLHVFIYPFGLL